MRTGLLMELTQSHRQNPKPTSFGPHTAATDDGETRGDNVNEIRRSTQMPVETIAGEKHPPIKRQGLE
jgi:hypothetical protein